MKARALLKKLIAYGVTVRQVGHNIRLSPRRLINDKVIAFASKNKEDLLAALLEEHQEKKCALGYRMQILRVLIKNKLRSEHLGMAYNELLQQVESHLDGELVKHGYDLETAIKYWQDLYGYENLDVYDLCKKCRNVSAYCRCENTIDVVNYIVTCDQCKHFMPDQIGDGAGIGQCVEGKEWTQKYNGRMPLFRYATRYCEEFIK
jgi:hypothetical protein